MACCIARRSPPRRPTCGGRRGDWPPASPWPCDFGPDLSRGFRALKTWFTLKVYGTEALGAAISRTCALARYLESRIAETPELELLAPVELNIVCFRYRAEDAHRMNARIVIELQESGAVAPSTTVIGGRLAIRAAIVNHRTGQRDLDALVEKTVALGRALETGAAQSSRRGATPAPRTGRRAAPAKPRCASSTRASQPIPARRACDSSAPACSPNWAGLWKRGTPTSTCWRASPRIAWR